MSGSDELLFSDDEIPFCQEDPAAEKRPWKVLIMDDEDEVHRATRLVLSDFEFEGRGVEFLSAYSGAEGLDVLRDNPDTAIILLDVVMESSEAGLHVIHAVRKEIGNKLVRIILRTGQPGQAPEHEVITEYDINDYKEKSELTSQKLYTSMISALRCYRDILTLERHRRGLKQIIEASSDLFGVRSIRQLAMGVLNQLSGTLGMSGDAVFLQAFHDGVRYSCRVMAGIGRFETCNCIDDERSNCLDAMVGELVEEAIEAGHSLVRESYYVGVFPGKNRDLNLLYLEGSGCCENQQNEELITVFSQNVSVAVDNVHLNRELIDTKREVVQRLGEALERRESSSGSHARRVSEMAGTLCRLAGCSDDDVERIMLAAAMHDVGNVGVPDTILKKNAPLDEEERQVMRMHPVIGHDLLGGSSRKLLGGAATVALQHHERWDGSGYPQGLKGSDIHPWARMVAICDVFDSVLHDRPYAPAWTMEEAVKHLVDNRGILFDPNYVDLLVVNLGDFQFIQEAYPDE